ncbi:G-type lectin S-receptor-like serine/threonine-protein kinase At2g19130 [Papaver somniferum]|uniref:G-type lectin S-receptor-like serine/threonine-protein kinase At2g19130 n=1 Tax=Papaver somniferum TaxID=3469 RepID=UPI000E6FD5FB|nr:G-type lectin S-receptor-like serine/threonine-protein kinase At2g19130 [Papaver somniferum]
MKQSYQKVESLSWVSSNQSFDYPTDTWLPGGKIGLNKKTKEPQLLTSWRNQEDPAPGIFTLELDPAGTDQTLIRWNKSEQFWRSGIDSYKISDGCFWPNQAICMVRYDENGEFALVSTGTIV